MNQTFLSEIADSARTQETDLAGIFECIRVKITRVDRGSPAAGLFLLFVLRDHQPSEGS